MYKKEISDTINAFDRMSRKPSKLSYSMAKTLQKSGYVTMKYKTVPFLDKPNKMTKISVGYVLTNKGKNFYNKIKKEFR